MELTREDDRFIAKEISRLEMDALTKFAPAYFEYTRKAFRGQVSRDLHREIRDCADVDRLATKCARQDLWFLQDWLSKCHHWTVDEDERPDYGKSFLRQAILKGKSQLRIAILFIADRQIYDLKGSTRNRLIQPTGRVNEVL